jgi:hypothetical protein
MIDYYNDKDIYDYSYSFCGLHGRTRIKDPSKPIDFDMLNGGTNEQYNCSCGFYPKYKEDTQLSLF